MKTLVLALTIFSIASSAYTFKEENKPISSQKLLKEAVKLGLTASREEKEAKQAIKKLPEKTVRTQLESDAADPLLLEEKSNQKALEDAKVIARTELYKAVQKRWNKIKDSVLNESAQPSFERFSPYLKRDLARLEYLDTNDPKAFLFKLPWADVKVDAKLKKVSYVIRIGSHLDGNTLEEGVEDLRIPERTAE